MIYLGKKGLNRINQLIIHDQEVILDEEIFIHLKDKIVTTLVYNDYLEELSKQYHFHYYAFLNNKKYKKYNTILTIEGLISYIIAHRSMPLYHSKILILGNGDCARCLYEHLLPFKCDITLGVRHIKNIGNESYISDLDYNYYDLIINTIPHRIITHQKIDQLRKDIIIYDIASFPYGLDHQYALKNNIQAYILNALPDRYAFNEAANQMMNIIKEVID